MHPVRNRLLSVREWCQKHLHSGWSLTVAVFLMVFIKQELFYRSSLNLFPISWLWNTQDVFWPFYLPKLAISLMMASIVLFFKRRYWVVAVSFLWDLLFVAELVYFRANGSLMNLWAVTMAGNMAGFWDSTLVFFQWSDMRFFLLTALLWGILWLFNDGKRYLMRATATLAIVYLISAQAVYHTCEWRGMGHIEGHRTEFCLNPLSKTGFQAFYQWEPILYCNDYSIYHYILYQFNFLQDIIADAHTLIPVTDEEMAPFIQADVCPSLPETPLVICLIESLESWVVTPSVMPNLSAFIQQEEHLLYATGLKSERLYGSSADGQMIVETGLLPIQEGAACFRYPGNTYPSLNSLYRNVPSASLIPHSPSIWNQSAMNVSYGYDTCFVSSPYDKLLFEKLLEISDRYRSILTFTMTSHTPFTAYADSSSLLLPLEMPVTMSNYIKSMNVVDAGLKVLLDAIRNDSALHHSTVVITADHSIFYPEKRNEFSDYCRQNGVDYDVTDPHCPLIVYSPLISEKCQVEEEAYQMDIFPTILDILNVDYFWKGVGVSLMNPDFNNLRPIDEESAFCLCDRIIRSNYFNQYRTSILP